MSNQQELVKIFTVCLASPKKFKAAAIYNGEALVITQVVPITGTFGLWKGPLIKEVQEKVAQGFIVLVEEKTDIVSRHATKYLLEDMNQEEEKRSNYYDAFDWAYALAATENLVLDAELQRFDFTRSNEGGKIERTSNDKGQTVYRVNWSDFHGGFRAVLLCVVAACYEPLSERYLTEMFKADPRTQVEQHPAQRFKALINDVAIERGRELERMRGGEGS